MRLLLSRYQTIFSGGVFNRCLLKEEQWCLPILLTRDIGMRLVFSGELRSLKVVSELRRSGESCFQGQVSARAALKSWSLKTVRFLRSCGGRQSSFCYSKWL